MPFPGDPSFVTATEAKLGVVFPLGFVARMIRQNGGEAHADGDVWHLYPFLDTSDLRRLRRTCNDIVHETGWSREHAAGFPQEAVAIAGNGSGDQLVLMPDPSRPNRLQNAVYVWSHENGDVAEVAGDFTDITEQEERTGMGDERRRPTRG